MLIFKYLNQFYRSILMALTILILSIIPVNPSNGVGFFEIPHADKYAHFVLYFLLAFILLYEILKNRILNVYVTIIPVFVCIVFGGGIELIQYFQPYRSSEFMDLIANFIGALTAVPVFLIFRSILKRYGYTI